MPPATAGSDVVGLPAELPAGPKSAVFDNHSKELLVDTRGISKLTLTRLDSGGRVLEEEDLGSFDAAHFRNPVLGIGGDGALLVGVGRELLRRDPVTHVVKRSRLPDTLAPPPVDSSEGGVSSLRQIGDTVEVTIGGTTSLLGLRGDRWRLVADLPVYGFDGSAIAPTADGARLVSGKVVGEGRPALAVAAVSSSDAVQLTSYAACRATRTTAPTCVTHSRGVSRYGSVDLTALPNGIDIENSRGGLQTVSDDGTGSLWMWHFRGSSGATILRVDPDSGSIDSVAFPLVEVARDVPDNSSGLGAATSSSGVNPVSNSSRPSAVVDPGVTALVPINAGTAFLFTRAGIDSERFGSAYSTVYLISLA